MSKLGYRAEICIQLQQTYYHSHQITVMIKVVLLEHIKIKLINIYETHTICNIDRYRGICF